MEEEMELQVKGKDTKYNIMKMAWNQESEVLDSSPIISFCENIKKLNLKSYYPDKHTYSCKSSSIFAFVSKGDGRRHLFVQSLIKHLLSTCSVPHTVLGTKETMMRKNS